MKQYRYLILLVTCVTFFCMKCTKKEAKPIYYIDQEFKDYVVFPEGSYWIYEDSASGDNDSVYLLKQSIKIVGKSSMPFRFEKLTQHLTSSYYNETIVVGGGAQEKVNNSPCFYLQYPYNNYSNIEVLFFSETEPGETFFMYDNECKYMELKEEFAINNLLYKDVKVFHNLSQEFDHQGEKIYYSKYIGLIRKELFNGQVWNLKKYHINY